jgi:N-acetyl-1-D-myo-inositol-2-amino-2-deoxy-alpha-D-glucopyranoside deacetylase
MTNVNKHNGNGPLTVMAVRAHPDDECFTVGGTLACYSQRGVRTVLVICTGGENGEIVDEELNTPEIRARLGEVRYEELQESVRILGISDVEMLGYRDSGMAGTPENEDPRSFNKADFDEATGRLVALIRKYKPHVLITDNEEGSYGHPDHIMCNKITVAARDPAADPAYRPDLGPPHQVAKLYYTAFARFQIIGTWRKMKELGLEMPWRRDEDDGDAEPAWGLPDDEIGAMIDIRAQLDQKRRSLLAHHTQIKPDMWMLTLPPEVFEGFLGYETFQRVKSTVPVEGREDDLFAGLREREPAL